MSPHGGPLLPYLITQIMTSPSSLMCFTYGPFVSTVVVDSSYVGQLGSCRYIHPTPPGMTPALGIALDTRKTRRSVTSPKVTALDGRFLFSFHGWNAEVARCSAVIRVDHQVLSDMWTMEEVFAIVGMAWSLLRGGVVLHASGVVVLETPANNRALQPLEPTRCSWIEFSSQAFGPLSSRSPGSSSKRVPVNPEETVCRGGSVPYGHGSCRCDSSLKVSPEHRGRGTAQGEGGSNVLGQTDTGWFSASPPTAGGVPHALLFVGPSGVGKSTLAAHISGRRGEVPESAPLVQLLADDQVVCLPWSEELAREIAPPSPLRDESGGTRWLAADANVQSRQVAWLKRMFFISQSPRSLRNRLTVPESVRRLLRCCCVWSPSDMIHPMLLDNISALAGSVECFDLQVCLDNVAGEVFRD